MPRVLAKLLGFKATDAVQDGTHVHAKITDAHFSGENGEAPPGPWALLATLVVTLDGFPTGSVIDFDYALAWVHGDGTGPGYYGYNHLDFVGNGQPYNVQTATEQFNDAPDTPFMLQVKVQNLRDRNGNTYPDQVTSEPFGVRTPEAPPPPPQQAPQPQYQPPPPQYQPPPTPPQNRTPPQPTAQPPPISQYQGPAIVVLRKVFHFFFG